MGRRTRAFIGIVVFVVGLMLLTVPAFAAKGDKNPTCADLGLDTVTKFDSPVTSGTQDGVTLTVIDNADGDDFEIDWSSTVPIDAVIVKGGPGANIYTYDGATGDDGLVTPTNPKNNKAYGLSHVTFCNGAPDVEPSVEPSEEPSEEPSVLPTRTSRDTDDDTDDDTEVLGGQLARTGPAEMMVAGSLGAMFTGGGLILTAIPRRRRTTK